MPKKKEEELNVKYYSLKDVTPKEMVEDFLFSKEQAEKEALEEEGWEMVGVISGDSSEERDELIEKLAADME